MKLTPKAQKAYERALGGSHPLEKNHADFLEAYLNFTFDELDGQVSLSPKERHKIVLAALVASDGIDAYPRNVVAALRAGVPPEEIQEILYQSVVWSGLARAEKFFYALDKAFAAEGISLPLPPRSNATFQTRMQKGFETHKKIYPGIGKVIASAPDYEQRTWKILVANVFGDYYTRGGLELAEREFIAFALALCAGADDSQLRGMIAGLAKLGYTARKLEDVALVLLPFVGYARAPRAIKIIHGAFYKDKGAT